MHVLEARFPVTGPGAAARCFDPLALLSRLERELGRELVVEAEPGDAALRNFLALMRQGPRPEAVEVATRDVLRRAPTVAFRLRSADGAAARGNVERHVLRLVSGGALPASLRSAFQGFLEALPLVAPAVSRAAAPQPDVADALSATFPPAGPDQVCCFDPGRVVALLENDLTFEVDVASRKQLVQEWRQRLLRAGPGGPDDPALREALTRGPELSFRLRHPDGSVLPGRVDRARVALWSQQGPLPEDAAAWFARWLESLPLPPVELRDEGAPG